MPIEHLLVSQLVLSTFSGQVHLAAKEEYFILEYCNGRDLTAIPRRSMVIDLYPLKQSEVILQFSAVYQHVADTVKSEREQNREAFRRENWHWFGRTHETYRSFTKGLTRFIVTFETMKHRIFLFIDGWTRADSKLIAIGSDNAAHLSVLSSRLHVTWCLAQGTLLEDRPVYPKTRCFDPFPFPNLTEVQKTHLRSLGEQLDAHRKAQQKAHPS